MKTYKANEIKNITFVSSVGFSETVLVETMMYEGRGILCRSNKDKSRPHNGTSLSSFQFKSRIRVIFLTKYQFQSFDLYFENGDVSTKVNHVTVSLFLRK